MDCDTLRDMLTSYGCVSPDPQGGAISAPFAFNLMFRTSIGPRGDVVGFLRPETAQGIFVSFRDLLYYNGGKLPFAAAQIGQSFRNEINPKQGLLRVREFTQAEIEHFVHPEDKEHPRFKEVAQVAPIMASAQVQAQGSAPAAMALGDAVKQGVVANETLAYFIGRTYLFMVAVGINPKRMMFRQHLPNEMAHYASGAHHKFIAWSAVRGAAGGVVCCSRLPMLLPGVCWCWQACLCLLLGLDVHLQPDLQA